PRRLRRRERGPFREAQTLDQAETAAQLPARLRERAVATAVGLQPRGTRCFGRVRRRPGRARAPGPAERRRRGSRSPKGGTPRPPPPLPPTRPPGRLTPWRATRRMTFSRDAQRSATENTRSARVSPPSTRMPAAESRRAETVAIVRLPGSVACRAASRTTRRAARRPAPDARPPPRAPPTG